MEEKKNDLKIKHDLKSKGLDRAQSKSKDFCSLVGVTKHVKEFVANDAGFSGCNLTNKLHHERNLDIAQLIFGFQSFEENLLCVKAFFTSTIIACPRMCYENNKMTIDPASLNYFEQTIVAKISMQSFTHRMKFGTIIDVCRFAISRATNKCLPLWVTCGLCLSLLPMPHDY